MLIKPKSRGTYDDAVEFVKAWHLEDRFKRLSGTDIDDINESDFLKPDEKIIGRLLDELNAKYILIIHPETTETNRYFEVLEIG